MDSNEFLALLAHRCAWCAIGLRRHHQHGRSRTTKRQTRVQYTTNDSDNSVSNNSVSNKAVSDNSRHTSETESNLQHDGVGSMFGRGHANDGERDGTIRLVQDQPETIINTLGSKIASASTVCEQIREHLIDTQGHNRVRRYLSGTVTMTHTQDGTLELVAGDRFTLDMIERRLGEPLRIAAQFAMGTTKPTIIYTVDVSRNSAQKSSNAAAGRDAQSNTPKHNTHPLANRINHTPGAASPRAGGARFPACPSLSDFLVGTSNRLAFEGVCARIVRGRQDTPAPRRNQIRPPTPPWVQSKIHHRRSVHQRVRDRDPVAIGRSIQKEVSRA